MKEMNWHKYCSNFVDMLLLIGGVFLSYYFCPRGAAAITILSLIFSLLIWIVLLKQVKVLQEIRENIGISILALSSSTIVLEENYSWFIKSRGEQIYRVASFFDGYADKMEKLLIIGLMGCAILAGGVLLLLFWKKIIGFCKCFWKHCDVIDKRYIIICGIIVTVAIIVIYNITNIFSNTGVKYNVVYSSDTGSLCMGNVWLQVNHGENDVRQPLFALGSIPFSSLAALGGRVLFLMPNIYIILLAIMQGGLLLLVNAMLAKLLKIEGHVKVIYYLISSFGYSNIIFMLNLEQYVFSVFYLIMFFYCILNKEDEKVNGYLYALATGSLITSAVVCVWKEKYLGWKDIIKTIFRRVVIFIGVLSMFGRLRVFLNLERFKFVLSFSSYNEEDTLSVGEKLLQYFNFIKSVFVKPQIQIVEDAYYRLAEVNSISIIGGIILLLAILGFCVTYKNRVSQISAFWMVFSFGVLVIGGWGARENGMILYTLYFGWAFTLLLFQLFNKLCEKWKKAGVVLGYTLSAAVLIINCVGILELIQFGISRYPH